MSAAKYSAPSMPAEYFELEFEDVPGKRALALSSAGEVDGEVQRIGTLSRDYPTLMQILAADQLHRAVPSSRQNCDSTSTAGIRSGTTASASYAASAHRKPVRAA